MYQVFTFQYGSIKSYEKTDARINGASLHSSMVLLNPSIQDTGNTATKVFTFQYGSIKSKIDTKNLVLHGIFTFQYGSIKSPRVGKNVTLKPCFTFQYGSIKSENACGKPPQPIYSLHSSMVLLNRGFVYK